MTEKAYQEQWPQAQMEHYVSHIEDVMPIWDLLYVNEIDNTAVDDPVENIACSTAYDEAKEDIFDWANSAALDQIQYQPSQQDQAERCKDPSAPLKHPKHSAHISDVCEM